MASPATYRPLLSVESGIGDYPMANEDELARSEGKPHKGDKSKTEKAADELPLEDVFRLESAFPDASSCFIASVVPPIKQCDALVVLDTNALLLPYDLESGPLHSLKGTYETLAAEKRLFLPARVAREFVNNRDKRLGELLQGLTDEGSKAPSAAKALPPYLRTVPGHADLDEASKALDTARRAYLKAIQGVRDSIGAWRGDDPVTKVYAAVFDAINIVEHGCKEENEEVARRFKGRRDLRSAPGTKDSGKADGGIGDFLIWLTILKLGEIHRRDLVFVTGDAKNDWMVRSGNKGVYPRPDLLAEYRQASGGRALRFSTLAGLLGESEAPAEVVREVETAEDNANARAHATINATVSNTFGTRIWSEREHVFDYSANDGMLTLNTKNGVFDLRFSKADNHRIYLLKSGSTARIARVKNARSGDLISIEAYDTTSSTYTIGLGEVFLVENSAGGLLVARVTGILDDTRDDAPSDEVRFTYSTWPKGALGLVS